MAPHYCGVCRRTSFAGRRHLYSAAHRRRLREALGRLQAKARAPPRDGALLAGEPGRGGAAAALRGVGRGLRAVGAGGRRRRRGPPPPPLTGAARQVHRVAGAGPGRLRGAGGRAHPRDGGPHPGSGAPAAGDGAGRPRGWCRPAAEPLRQSHNFLPDLLPTVLQQDMKDHSKLPICRRITLSSLKRDISHDAEQPGPSGMQKVPDFNWMEPGQALTFIGHQETEGKGNIHTGARPPWLINEEEEVGSQQQIGPSYEEFLKEKEKQKLKKLPADRVGANFDHTSQTGDSWLPSFGRVWNHGRRWQSRHQFRAESGEKKKKR
ncbi:centrosomal AT-AC splicing factor isoform X3 [Struthio camelus]|uniref:centrosomal AT-AC splicing factor isoform X3 n=1 Tax=Struthio camelus TaxID=8801 RepID=UPI003603FCC5